MKITYARAIYNERERELVDQVFSSGWLSGGKFTSEFEQKLANWWGVKYAISVNSGSSANFIAMQALEVKGEVITPGLSFPTTISAIVYQNCTPVFIDSDENLLIDLDQLEEAITPDTKVVMFAHTLGNVCDMDRLMRIVKKHDLRLIEDCCDAVSSKWKGQKVGTFGDLATVSFYPAHHMTTFGEGGAILTNSRELYKKCVSIRDWGRDCTCKWDESGCPVRFANPPFDHKYYYTRLGMNLKMTEAQAAFGVAQLDRLDGFVQKRIENYEYLKERVNLNVVSKIQNATVSWFALPILAKEEKEPIMSYLEGKGIQTRAIFAGNITRHPAYQKIGRTIKHNDKSDLKVTDKIMKSGFFVGVHPALSKNDLDFMAKEINASSSCSHS